jgi:DNA-binding MarR family transcriptional regulator
LSASRRRPYGDGSIHEQFDDLTMAPDTPALTIARLARVLENNSPADLSLPQFRVLGQLSTGDERASRLAVRLAVAKPTLTALIDSLVERGYVTREASPSDRRVVQLSITPAGRVALTSAEAQLREALDEVFGLCPDPDLVLAALEELRVALDRRWAERSTTAPPEAPGRAAEPSTTGRRHR